MLASLGSTGLAVPTPGAHSTLQTLWSMSSTPPLLSDQAWQPRVVAFPRSYQKHRQAASGDSRGRATKKLRSAAGGSIWGWKEIKPREVAQLPAKLWDEGSYLQASNASPLLRPKLHSESDPLSVCFPKPLVTPAKDTQSEPECRNQNPWHVPQQEAATLGGLGRRVEASRSPPLGNGSWVVERTW